MSQLEEIYEGWKNLIFPNKQAEELAKQRIKSCVDCDQFKKDTKRCGICGCFMPAKVRSKESECPVKKW